MIISMTWSSNNSQALSTLIITKFLSNISLTNREAISVLNVYDVVPKLRAIMKDLKLVVVPI